MVGAKTGIATHLNKIGPRAFQTHCYGQALPLAIDDTIKAIKLMRDTTAASFELNKLKREGAFNSC